MGVSQAGLRIMGTVCPSVQRPADAQSGPFPSHAAAGTNVVWPFLKMAWLLNAERYHVTQQGLRCTPESTGTMDLLGTHSVASIAALSMTTKKRRRHVENSMHSTVTQWNIIQLEKGTWRTNLENISLNERNRHEKLLINR